MNYQLTATCETGKCLLEIEKDTLRLSGKRKVTAEEWITDQNALNKDKSKLVRGLSKFRIKTVDFADALFTNAQTAMGAAPAVAQTAAPAATAAAVQVATVKPDVSSIPAVTANTPAASGTASLNGYKAIAPDKIPETS